MDWTAPPLERHGLVDQIAGSIRNDILRGALKPDERISQAGIAKQLGVSHIPVREAIRRLEAEALVTSAPHRGTVVAAVCLEELHGIYDLRRLIEGDTIRRAATLYTDRDVASIRKAKNQLVRSDPAAPDGEFWVVHREFHWALLRPQLDAWRRRTLGLLWQSAERYQRLFALVFGSVEHAQLEHAALAEAAAQGQPDDMYRRLVSHLDNTEQTVTRGYLLAHRGNAGEGS